MFSPRTVTVELGRNEISKSTVTGLRLAIDVFISVGSRKYSALSVMSSVPPAVPTPLVVREIKCVFSWIGDCVVVENADVTKGDLPKADVYILFLTMMFIPIEKRKALIDDMRANCKQGGVIVVVDKICDHGGYFATVLKRLTMQFKLQQGAKPEDVLNKEMSLAGVQIPIDPSILGSDAKQFFRMGEFAGWVIEK